MYSLVLLMAMTGSAQAPAFGHHSCCGCSGSYGCCGGSYGCCGGYSYGCCGGSSCCGGGYGCCGGWSSCCGGGHHHGHHHHHSCCGGSYGCCGGSSCGGYGCCGGWSYGCCGGGYGCCGGSYGCSGGYGCDGGYMMGAPAGVPVQVAPPPDGKPAPMPKPPVGGEKPKEEVSAPAPATIQVSLPADAKLMIDDAATTSTSASRVFVSPELPPQKDFQYTLKAEIVRDGQKLTATERITVRAGQETSVSMPLARFATASVAAK